MLTIFTPSNKNATWRVYTSDCTDFNILYYAYNGIIITDFYK